MLNVGENYSGANTRHIFIYGITDFKIHVILIQMFIKNIYYIFGEPKIKKKKVRICNTCYITKNKQNKIHSYCTPNLFQMKFFVLTNGTSIAE